MFWAVNIPVFLVVFEACEEKGQCRRLRVPTGCFLSEGWFYVCMSQKQSDRKRGNVAVRDKTTKDFVLLKQQPDKSGDLGRIVRKTFCGIRRL